MIHVRNNTNDRATSEKGEDTTVFGQNRYKYPRETNLTAIFIRAEPGDAGYNDSRHFEGDGCGG